METLSGKIENVVYRNDINEYTVIELVTDDNRIITAVGSMERAFEGELVRLRGVFTLHKEFGEQFAFSEYEKSLPEDSEGILQYLSSSTVKGVGAATALKLVNRFGKDTFDVIENHPEWLADIPGITRKRAAAIAESFREQNGLREVMMFCRDYIGVGEASRVYKRYGSDSVGLVRENPYLLCEGSLGISFEKADKLALSLGIAQDDRNRILSGMRYVLAQNAALAGHTCIPYESMQREAAEVLGVSAAVIAERLSEFIDCGDFWEETDGDKRLIMTREVYESECFISEKIRNISHASSLSVGDIAALIEKTERAYRITYANSQREAIFKALDGGIMVLTGGPGTGKTTVVRALISIFRSMGLKTVLAAPTGRAANRMSEATGEEAKTIHRMLEMERTVGGEIRFLRNEKTPLRENAVIIDEASMIDLPLMNALMRALRRDTKIVFIGDSDQLPSVGAGNVLADLIACGRIPTVRLTEIFRQSEESLIVKNAHKINNGEAPILTSTDSDFFFVSRANEADIPMTVAELITKRLPRRYGEDIVSNIQVITPSRKGAGGVENLNRELQARLNPKTSHSAEKHTHGIVLRVGDRVMQTVNNYDIEWYRGGSSGMGVFNGDTGVIESINTKENILTVRFDDDRVADYENSMLEELELAYAITVHKSQGSEYPVVIMPMYYCAPMLMTRNLLYTAITRARKMVILVGRADIARKMTENRKVSERYTTLRARLEAYF